MHDNFYTAKQYLLQLSLGTEIDVECAVREWLIKSHVTRNI